MRTLLTAVLTFLLAIGTGFAQVDGQGAAVYRPGGGVSVPVPLVKPEPEYSEEARQAKYQGSVTLKAVVNEKGETTAVRVVKKLGLGLDEKAIEAVQKWRFNPGMKDGEPVPVMVTIEVSFRLPAPPKLPFEVILNAHPQQ